MDSDSESSRNYIDPDTETDDDEEMALLGFYPHEEYGKLLEELRNTRNSTAPISFQIVYREAFEAILENIDEFCAALSNVNHMEWLQLGTGIKIKNAIKLEVTEERQEAWVKFLHALGRIQTIKNLAVGGFIFSAHNIAQILEALPGVENLVMFNAPWYTISGEDMNVFVEAISNHPCPKVKLHLGGFLPDEDDESNEPFNHVEGSSIIGRLLRLERLWSVCLEYVKLSLDECKSLSDALASNGCSTRVLDITNCFFVDDGGRLIVEALTSNTTLEELTIEGHALQDAFFCAALDSSLPLNTSIRKLCICGIDDAASSFTLLRNIGRHNSTITEIQLIGSEYVPFIWVTKEEEMDLITSFEQNFSLQSCTADNNHFLAAITRLNAAGRSYLQQDASSKSHCIDVLGEVKDHLDCIFYHLRENPILFSGGIANASGCDSSVRKKRKAAIAGEKARRRIKKA
jgi:hypothetical protein